jgi:hypothetical protein
MLGRKINLFFLQKHQIKTYFDNFFPIFQNE